MPTFKDITGQRFGRLLALEPVPRNKSQSNGNRHWRCLCDCGKTAIVGGDVLGRGRTKSCGCLRRKHGLWGSRIYMVWQSMMQRCYNPNNHAYKDYGGRGIEVCKRWHEVTGFFSYVGNAPRGKSLDRIDNDGNYEPDNVRWATTKQQARNRRPARKRRREASASLGPRLCP
jgi:hypothetical protein